ncbi:hypothetical protein MC885_014804, partial [Smutsia gigantea]
NYCCHDQACVAESSFPSWVRDAALGSRLACQRSTEMQKLGNPELEKEEENSTSENFARKTVELRTDPFGLRKQQFRLESCLVSVFLCTLPLVRDLEAPVVSFSACRAIQGHVATVELWEGPMTEDAGISTKDTVFDQPRPACLSSTFPFVKCRKGLCWGRRATRTCGEEPECTVTHKGSDPDERDF